jgi:hypothetical protein
VQDSRESRARGASEDAGGKEGGLGRAERLECQLAQAVAAPQLRAEPRERVSPGDFVVAIRREEEQWPILECVGEPGKKLQRGVVRPLQVIEADGCRAVRSDGVESTRDRLEHCGAVGFRGSGRPELG